MKAYPYQSQPRDEQSTKTTYVVNSYEQLSPDDIARAIADPSLSRNGWGYVHPVYKTRWARIEIFAPLGFATALVLQD
jgi:hypothetical protein